MATLHDTKSASLRNLFKKRFSASGPSVETQISTSRSSLLQQNQSSIVRLDHDILLIVFDLLQSTSPKTLQALALVNWTFHDLTSRARSRVLRIDTGPEELQATHDYLKRLERKDLLSFITTINASDGSAQPYGRVRGSSAPDPFAPDVVNYLNFINYVADLIPRMTGLAVVNWNYSTPRGEHIPDNVLEALRLRPKVRLYARATDLPPHVVGFDRTVQLGTPNTNLLKLQNNTNLSHLSAKFHYTSGQSCRAGTQPLKQILMTAPCLRSLALDISMPSGGCVMYAMPRTYCGFGFVGGEPFPHLEELVVHSYPWASSYQSDYPNEGDEMEFWADKFDWSRLRRLETSYVRLAVKLMPKLTALKEVVFNNSWPEEDIPQFLDECPTALEAIGVKTSKPITLASLHRHGPTLRTLHIHDSETRTNNSWATTAMDDMSLRTIQEFCPNIEDLFLDIPRNKSWPWSALDILADFPHLKNLKICFELGIGHKCNPVKPYVTMSSVRKIFSYLLAQIKKKRPNSPCKLARLHIMSGSSELVQGYLGSTSQTFWPNHNKAEFVAVLSERDDEADNGVFTVTCTRAGTHVVDIKEGTDGSSRRGRKSQDLTQRKPGEKSALKVDRDDMSKRIRLAEEGPIPRKSWGGSRYE